MIKLSLLKNPSPDFKTFENILKGEKKPQKVPFAELLIDPEVVEFINNAIMGIKMPSLQDIIKEKINKFTIGEEIALLSQPEEKLYWKHYINFYYSMGYDYAPDITPLFMHGSMVSSTLSQVREVADTAVISKGKRMWAEEGKGVITCWEDFKNFPWEAMNLKVEEYYHFLDENLPEGMKIVVEASVYELIMERLLGYEGMFYLLYDDPKLVKAVFDKLGKIIYNYYKNVISLDCVGAIFHGDDLGFKTSTMLNPDVLRELFFPWMKKYASLAHQYNKMFWYHCCGYKYEIMDDLINDVKIDALHSFEDACCPVTEYKRRYGNRIGLLGGVDMDKLCRLDEKNLRKYIRKILEECMINGRYALGSGNSIANYVPIENYFIMLEEGSKWR